MTMQDMSILKPKNGDRFYSDKSLHLSVIGSYVSRFPEVSSKDLWSTLQEDLVAYEKLRFNSAKKCLSNLESNAPKEGPSISLGAQRIFKRMHAIAYFEGYDEIANVYEEIALHAAASDVFLSDLAPLHGSRLVKMIIRETTFRVIGVVENDSEAGFKFSPDLEADYFLSHKRSAVIDKNIPANFDEFLCDPAETRRQAVIKLHEYLEIDGFYKNFKSEGEPNAHGSIIATKKFT
jgi:hypothetical protein